MNPQQINFDDFVSQLGVSSTAPTLPKAPSWSEELQTLYKKNTPKPGMFSGLGSELKSDLDTRVERTGEILNRKDSSATEKGVQLLGQGAGLTANAIEQTASRIPGVKQVTKAASEGIDWLANSENSPIKHLGDVIGNSKTLQELTTLYDTDTNFRDTVDGIANTVRLGGDVQAIVDSAAFSKNITNKVITKVKEASPIIKEAAANTLEKAKGMVEDKFANSFDKTLNDAEKAIFPKLTPTEKASVTLKESKGILGKKSVPDLINDPKTKSIIESVANLPDDIKVKPSDTLVVKESKLNQGISRLHQETANLLSEPKMRKETTFTPDVYDEYIKSKYLKPIKDEFGTNSIEYKEALKATKLGKELIKSNDGYGVHTARQEFDSLFKEKNPRAYTKAKGSFGSQLDPKTSATIEAGRSFRNTLNDFNETILPENSPFRSRLREESNLIRAKEEMRKRSIGEIDKNAVQRALQRNPTAKKAVETVGGALKVGAGIEAINHL